MATLEKIPKNKLLDMFRSMLLTKRFEERLIEELSLGRVVSEVHSSRGQEAVAAGTCANLRKDDYIRTSVRSIGEMLCKGVPIDRLMAEHFGKAGGYSHGHGNPMHCIAVEVGMMGGDGSLGAGMPIGTGLALAEKMKGTDRVVVIFFGEGTSNNGRFHEGLNFAAIWKAPVIYLCSNNLYALSTPTTKSMAIRDIADRAAGYGIPGVVVDGQDVLAVYEAVGKAVARARTGEGPTLIEAKTFRFRGHFEGDAQTYRTKEEIQEYTKKDPIELYKKKLIGAGALTEKAVEEMDQKILEEIDKAVKFALESSFPKPEEASDYAYV